MTGAPGTLAGVTAADRAEYALTPTELLAATVNVYAVPLVRPVTTRVLALAAAVTVLSTVAPVPV